MTDPSGSDPDGLVKSIGVIAMLSGKSGLLDTVEKCVKVTQVRLSVYLHVCKVLFVYDWECENCPLYRVAGCPLFRGCLSIEVNGRTVGEVCY